MGVAVINRRSSRQLGSLLHLADPMLPIGGFNFSNGLETYVQHGIVKDEDTAERWIVNQLTCNLAYNDVAFASLSFDAAERPDIEKLIELDAECAAFKGSREIRDSGRKLGTRLLRIYERAHSDAQIHSLAAAVREKRCEGQYPIVYGALTSALRLPLEDALHAFCYSAAVGMVTNAVKLVPLGQMAGQDILFRLAPIMEDVAKAACAPDSERLGLCSVGFEIRSMQHEELYSRLYMS